MSNNPGSGADEVRLSSKDLEYLLQAGGLNFEGVDLLQMDPNVAQQLLQIKASQSSDPNLNTTAVSNTRQSKPKSGVSRQPSRGTPVSGPFVEIVEQPKARGLRFRYECEGRSAGSIPGETSTPERKTFPAIKIHNYSGPAVIVVSCVTKDEPYKPHPHNLVGKDCKKGVCTLRIRDTATVTFPHLGIQCAKRKDVEGNLKQRQDINVDPYQTGFKHKGQNIDLNVVRLCFQVFLPDENGKITRIVPPVVSQPIHDKKALNDLVICRVDRTSGKPKGGDEVFLLCEKINRDDVRVRFYEEIDGQTVWEAFGDFGQNDVHRQYAIVFKTPPYSNDLLQQPREVNMQLQRISDQEGSDPILFTYQPEDPDPDRILEKRKRKAATLNFLHDAGGSSPINQEQLKQRLKLKATRTGVRTKQETVPIKEEVTSPQMPQYSFNNIGAQKPMLDVTMQQSMAQMDVSATTIASQSSMSGGKIQYNTPLTTQQSGQVPSVTLTPQILQLLLTSGGLTTQQPGQPNPVLQQQQQQQQMSHPNPMMQQHQPPLLQSFQTETGMPQAQPDQQLPTDPEVLKQYLQQILQAANIPTSTQMATNTDTSMQSQSQEMNSLSSLDPNILSLIQGDSPMISFGSLEALSGNITDLNYDQSVAGFETVDGDGTPSSSQQQYDETVSAVQNLNG